MSSRTLLHHLLLLVASSLAACGGGGGSELPTGTGSVSGRLLVPVPAGSVAQRALPAADADGSTIARAAPLDFDAAATVILDAQDEGGRMRVLRTVSTRAGLFSVSCEAVRGLRVRFALRHLDRGESGRALDVAPGDVVDVVVWAVEGHGAVRVRLGPAALAERGASEPPAAYRGEAGAHREGEIVVRMRDGRRWETLPDASDYECVEEAGGWCRLRLRARNHAGSSDLDTVLARVERLRRGGRVEGAEPNWTRRLQEIPDDPRFDDQWALEQIRAPAAWELDRGEGQVVVATIDSGVKQGHPDLAGRLLPGYDFLDDDPDPEDPRTGFSHGTQTAGIIAAATNNGTGVAGVLWNGRILPLRAFDERGFGDSFDIAQAIRYAAGLTNSSGALPASPARVINASFAADSPTSVERDACQAAEDAGVLIVASTGNIGSSREHYPAAYDTVFAVGASTIDGFRALYSNYGTWMDLLAPGGLSSNGVLTPSVDSSGDFNYQEVNGTSFAAPHVAGVAALVLGVRDYDPPALRALLRATAQDVGAPGDDLFTGAGIVHAYAALRTALEIPGEGLIPGERVTVRLVRRLDARVVASATTTEALELAFDLQDLAEGSYRLEAGTDRDFDGEIDDPGEMYGVWTDGTGSDRLDLADGEALTDLEITLTLRA